MSERFFLPDFCTARNVVAVMVVAQLTAFVLTLARPAGVDPWTDLLRLSLFIQWIALVSSAVLCLCRRWLASSPPRRAAMTAFGLLVIVAVALAELAWWTARWSDIGVALVPASRAEFLLRTFGLSLVVSAAVLRYLWVQHQWRQRVESEARTRFAALQARIRPHFLFNSMNTIASLTRTDAAAAEQATEDLADLFRASIADSVQHVSLQEELDLCRRYARIEALRLGDRLRIDWRTDGLPGDSRLPSLTLQPLVENAIYHGVEPAAEGAVVTVAGRREGDTLIIEVSNPMPSGNATTRQGLHIALENVAERLALAFPGLGTLDTRIHSSCFIVTIRFPYAHTDR